MIPLPDPLYALLEYIVDEPFIMVFVASFGVLLGSGILMTIAHFVLKLLRIHVLQTLTQWVSMVIAFTFLFGFISQILLAFIGVSGLHLLAIWLATALLVLLLCLTHKRLIMQLWDDFDELKDRANRLTSR